jgi:hypothetical protein
MTSNLETEERLRSMRYVNCTQIKYMRIIIFREPEGKRSLCRHRHRGEDNIKILLTELVCKLADKIRTSSRSVNTKMIARLH